MKDPEKTEWLNLNQGEEVLYWEHPTIISIIPLMIGGIIISLMGIYVTIRYNAFGYWPLLLIPAGLLTMLSEYLRWVTTHYVLTSKRIVKKKGIVRRSIDELTYKSVMNTNDNQSIMERLLQYGDIEVYTAGTSGAEMFLDNLPKFHEASDIISERSTMEDS